MFELDLISASVVFLLIDSHAFSLFLLPTVFLAFIVEKSEYVQILELHWLFFHI